MEGESIAIINIASSSKMQHNCIAGRGGASTTCAITINDIRAGDGDDADSGNGAEDVDNYIVSSYSSLYQGRTNKQKK